MANPLLADPPSVASQWLPALAVVGRHAWHLRPEGVVAVDLDRGGVAVVASRDARAD